jgi:isochorismate synthase
MRDTLARLRAADAELPWVDELTRCVGGPRYLGGLAFPARVPGREWAPYPAGLLILPRFLLTLRAGTATLTVSLRIAPESDWSRDVDAALRDLVMLEALLELPGDHDAATSVLAVDRCGAEEWKAAVARIATEIRAGRYVKAVLARRVRARLGEPADIATALRRLRAGYPSATVFAVSLGDRCFLGATPELLVRLDSGRLEAACVAGSATRGVTQAEDEQLARALLASAKERSEHAVVVRCILDALAELCDDLRADPMPRLLKVRNVQHLFTSVRGRVCGDRDVLDLVECLHPTPAVGGFPREPALAAVGARERFDRGWYAGVVGWVGSAGDGEFAVALRSALLTSREAFLYAGSGVMADSDPDAEYAETCLKLRPMATALGLESWLGLEG